MVNGYAARAASICFYDCETVEIEHDEKNNIVCITLKGTDPYRDTRINVFARGDGSPVVTVKEPANAESADV